MVSTSGNTYAYPTKLYVLPETFRRSNTATTSVQTSGRSRPHRRETRRARKRHANSTRFAAHRKTRLSTPAPTRAREYPTNRVQSKVFSTITDFNDNRTGDTADTDGTDSPTLNDSDGLISYEGCGKATFTFASRRRSING